MSHIDKEYNPVAALETSRERLPAGQAVLTQAVLQFDIIHTSLVGMTAIVLILLVAVSLPAFGYAPVKELSAVVIMAVSSLAGIFYLYYMNYRVHQHMTHQASLTEVLVNSLGQAFMTFDPKGICGVVYSQACIDLFETIPANKDIRTVLHIPDAHMKEFDEWLEVLFMPNHALGFDDVAKFFPTSFSHSQGRHVALMYRPIRDRDGNLLRVVVIATDQTEEFEAQERAQQQQVYADMICRIFKERNQFMATLTHIRKFLDAAKEPIHRHESAPLLRSLHTLKAAVKHFHLHELGDIVHNLESELRNETIKSDAEFRLILNAGCTRISKGLADVLDQLHDLIGQDYEGRGNMHEIEESTLYVFAHQMEAANVKSDLIRRYMMEIVAVPLNDCFRQFEREMRDLAEITGKQVKPIRYTGTNPRVLTRPMQDFLFSLTHIARNIIDHGIEPPVARLARSKDAAGQVSIHAETEHDDLNGTEWLHLVIADDGNGIDPARVRAKLASIDPDGPWRDETDHEVIQRIFTWGFSTRDSVTDLSGRGVGIEAVEKEVQMLGGSITVHSEIYHGTRFDIRIPHSNMDVPQIGEPEIMCLK
jgi:two-component system chemotaxis sensor kinase CheA